MNTARQKKAVLSTLSERVASPCIRVCTLDHDNVCIGCRRTIDEITRWTRMTDAERTAIRERIIPKKD